jgi:regulatory protein
LLPPIEEGQLTSPLGERARSKLPSFDKLRVVSEDEPPKAGVRGNTKRTVYVTKSKSRSEMPVRLSDEKTKIVAKHKTITRIEVQKRNPRRRSVYLDGKFAFGVDEEVISKLGLEKGEEIGETDIKEILKQKGESEAKEAALRFLSFRRRTEKEVRDKLKRRGFDNRTIRSTIEKLKDHDLINDVEFAIAWVKERLAHKPRGKKLLRQELWKKGIKKEIIDQVTEELCQDEDKAASELLEKIKRRYRNLEPQVARRRMLGVLLRRGFSYEIARNTFSSLHSSSVADNET